MRNLALLILLQLVAAASPPPAPSRPSGTLPLAPLRFEQVAAADSAEYSVAVTPRSYRLTFRDRAAEPLEISVVATDSIAPVLRYQGHEGLSLDQEGNLVVRAGGRNIVQKLPAVFQRDSASLRLVSAAYQIGDGGTVELRLGPFDHTRPVEIAPLMVCPPSAAAAR